MTPARVVASIAALRAGQKSQRITVIHSKAGVGVRVSKASSIAGALVGGSPDTAVYIGPSPLALFVFSSVKSARRGGGGGGGGGGQTRATTGHLARGSGSLLERC